jgi:hypothetical protein
VTWISENGSHVLCSGGMSKNSKDDRVSKKNNYTQQIHYDHLNLVERTGLATDFFHSGATQRGPSMPATSASFHTHSRPGVYYRTSTRRIHASSEAWLNPHARLTRARTCCSTRRNNQTIAAELWECSRRRRLSQSPGKIGKVSSGEQAHRVC